MIGQSRQNQKKLDSFPSNLSMDLKSHKNNDHLSSIELSLKSNSLESSITSSDCAIDIENVDNSEKEKESIQIDQSFQELPRNIKNFKTQKSNQMKQPKAKMSGYSPALYFKNLEEVKEIRHQQQDNFFKNSISLNFHQQQRDARTNQSPRSPVKKKPFFAFIENQCTLDLELTEVNDNKIQQSVFHLQNQGGFLQTAENFLQNIQSSANPAFETPNVDKKQQENQSKAQIKQQKIKRARSQNDNSAEKKELSFFPVEYIILKHRNKSAADFQAGPKFQSAINIFITNIHERKNLNEDNANSNLNYLEKAYTDDEKINPSRHDLFEEEYSVKTLKLDLEQVQDDRQDKGHLSRQNSFDSFISNGNKNNQEELKEKSKFFKHSRVKKNLLPSDQLIIAEAENQEVTDDENQLMDLSNKPIMFFPSSNKAQDDIKPNYVPLSFKPRSLFQKVTKSINTPADPTLEQTSSELLQKSNIEQEFVNSVGLDIVQELETSEMEGNQDEGWFGFEGYSLFIFGPDNEFRNFLYQIV